MKLKLHKDRVLNASESVFDSGTATFGTVVYDDDRREISLFYTGASDVNWSEASIGLAISKDGLIFEKNPLLVQEILGLKNCSTNSFSNGKRLLRI